MVLSALVSSEVSQYSSCSFNRFLNGFRNTMVASWQAMHGTVGCSQKSFVLQLGHLVDDCLGLSYKMMNEHTSQKALVPIL
jgi:hypothetical protein